MLDQNGKKPYCQLTNEEQNFIDVKRASNEITLVDNINKTVIYGIDSLLKIIEFSFPWMEKVGHWRPVKFFLKKLYSFISYNRKVIIPSKVNKEIKLQCIPDFNFKYRFIYIVFAWLTSSLIAFKFLQLLPLEYSNFYMILFGVFIQMPIQSAFLLKYDKEVVMNYIGNLITISLFGGLVLMPIVIANIFFNLNSTFNSIYFIITIIVLIYEHYRRILVLELPKFLIFIWVVFIIFIFNILI